MRNFLTNNSWVGKLARTIAQGIIGVLVANIDLLVGLFSISAEWKAFIVAIVMAILSPVMAILGEKSEDKYLHTDTECRVEGDENGLE